MNKEKVKKQVIKYGQTLISLILVFIGLVLVRIVNDNDLIGGIFIFFGIVFIRIGFVIGDKTKEQDKK